MAPNVTPLPLLPSLLLVVCVLLEMTLLPAHGAVEGGQWCADTEGSCGSSGSRAPEPKQLCAKPTEFLGWLMGGPGITAEGFAAEYWDKKPILVSRSAKDHFAALRSLESEIFEYIEDRTPAGQPPRIRATRYTGSGRGMDAAPFRIGDVRPDGTLNPKREAGLWDETALQHMMVQEGMTVKVTDCQMFGDNALQLRNLAASATSHHHGINIYITPGKKMGFNTHFDSHDVFIIQVAGSKQWRVYKQLEEHPLRDYKEAQMAQSRPSLGKPILDQLLEAGDTLYIPAGYVHSADCLKQDAVSIHVTLGMYTSTHARLLDATLAALALKARGVDSAVHAAATALQAALAEAAKARPELRTPLPLGFHHAECRFDPKRHNLWTLEALLNGTAAAGAAAGEGTRKWTDSVLNAIGLGGGGSDGDNRAAAKLEAHAQVLRPLLSGGAELQAAVTTKLTETLTERYAAQGHGDF